MNVKERIKLLNKLIDGYESQLIYQFREADNMGAIEYWLNDFKEVKEQVKELIESVKAN